jgi:hypothetical protein
MSALKALVLAGKGLNAFSVLFYLQAFKRTCFSNMDATTTDNIETVGTVVNVAMTCSIQIMDYALYPSSILDNCIEMFFTCTSTQWVESPSKSPIFKKTFFFKRIDF